MDKELLKKHHFWFLLIPFVILALVCWIGLWTSVADATAEQRKKIDDHQKEMEGMAGKAKSKTLEAKLEEQKNVLLGRRMEMWKQAWEEQQSIYTWPVAATPNERKMLESLAFGAEITDRDTRAHIRTDEYYLKEYQDFVKKVEPLQFSGGWQSVLTYIKGWSDRIIPESEDIWLAYEDFWVQREMVFTIDSVNRKAAIFRVISPTETKGDGKEAVKDNPLNRKFANRFWELDLKVTTNTKGEQQLEGTLRNITQRLQPIGLNNEMFLKINWQKRDPDDIRPEPDFYYRIEGDFVEAGKEMKIKVLKEHKLTRKVSEIAEVEQVFDGRTVPVKRIDKLVMGQGSARTFSEVLKPAPFSQKVIDDAAAKAAESGSASGGETYSQQSGGGGGLGFNMGGGGIGGGTTATSTDNTSAGLPRKRYVDVTDQVRRMPIGMVLVLDQGFLPDVLEALANSKLRFQNTQFHWKRFKMGSSNFSYGSGPNTTGYTRPPNDDGDSDDRRGGSGGYGPKGFTPPKLGSSGSGFPMGTGFPMGGGFGNLSTTPTQSRDPLSASMIEMSVYGIASIYERYKSTTEETPAEKKE